eukprot:gene24083-44734_t
MISIASVKVTPDLLEARVYLSLFQVKDAAAVMKKIESKAWEIKKELADKMKHQLRRIPVIHFYNDDTLDYVFKMEEVFKKINEKAITAIAVGTASLIIILSVFNGFEDLVKGLYGDFYPAYKV